MKKYSVDYFIKKFKAIPSKNWITGILFNKDKTKFCVLGHCGVTNIWIKQTKESRELINLFNTHLHDESPSEINDGDWKTP